MGPTWVDYGTLIGEFTIAFAIYYEIEKTRASEFLSEAVGEAYKTRPRIYEAYVEATKTLPADRRAKAFREKILADPKLRKACDLQLVYFSKYHYILRWSLFHHNLMVKWFPHVLVRLWIMLSDYILNRSNVRDRWEREFMKAVSKSFKWMGKQNLLGQLTIQSRTGDSVVITADELSRARTDLEKLL